MWCYTLEKKNINLIRNFLSTTLWVFISFQKCHTFFNAATILLYRSHGFLERDASEIREAMIKNIWIKWQNHEIYGDREGEGRLFWKDPLLVESFETFVEKEVKLKC